MCQISRITQKGKDTGYVPFVFSLWKSRISENGAAEPPLAAFLSTVYFTTVSAETRVSGALVHVCQKPYNSLEDLREPFEWQKTWRLEEKSKNGPLSVSFDGMPQGAECYQHNTHDSIIKPWGHTAHRTNGTFRSHPCPSGSWPGETNSRAKTFWSLSGQSLGETPHGTLKRPIALSEGWQSTLK